MYPPAIIAAFEEFKGIWDPDGRINPDRVVRPAELDDDLRVFVGLPTIPTHADSRSPATAAASPAPAAAWAWASASRRRRVMCPSYRATGEEMHSTRGRARLLFEMATAR